MISALRSKWGLQAVLASALVLLMFVLTAALIRIAFQKFEEMAHEGARTIFGQQAREGNNRFAEFVARAIAFVDVQSQLGYPAEVREGPGQRALGQRWMAELAVNPHLYAYHVSLNDGSFFQLIAVRGDAEVQKMLGAPAGTQFASRIIRGAPQGATRTEHWRFLDSTGGVLAERNADAAYDARERGWYQTAIAQPDKTFSTPYLFASTRALGMTAARRLADGTGVAAADIDLKDLGRFFGGLTSTPHSVTALVDPQGRLVAWGTGSEAKLAPGMQPLARLGDTGDAVLASIGAWDASGRTQDVRVADVGGAQYVLAQSGVELNAGQFYRVVAYAPLSEFSSFILVARDQMLLFALLFLLMALVLALLGTDRIVSGLRALAQDARRIHAMDFAQTPRIRSKLREIDELGYAQALMKESIRSGTDALKASQQKLEDLISAGLNMSRERDRMGLLQQILWGARQLTHCDAVTLYVVTEQRTLRFALRTRDDDLPSFEIPLFDETGRENTQFVSAFVALRNAPVVIDDVYTEERFDLSGTRGFDVSSGYRTVSMLALPLAPREGEVIGVLQLMNALDPATGAVVPFDEESIRLAAALAAQAAVSLDNHQLVQSQQDLMDAMVRLIAGAIDAKSPYTGSHCERVPELAFMLAEEATRVTEGPLAGFGFHTPDEWREFRVGAWLHDCGKMTTPEYVVDKATKLETIYDRIHEIRTRFEVLWRDAQIDYLQALLDGQDAAAAAALRDARQAVLREDFAFLAECNLGAEFMAPERVTRLQQIGAQTWWRHFDDRLGIAHGALAQLHNVPPRPPPALEKLLDDKPEHLIARPPEAAPDPRHGFRLDVPQHLYNHGELHNLSVSRGTLTAEERYKINEHIMQTIVMLDAMPFPKNLRRVPEYAGTHHETLTGNGYPRRLSGDQLSVPARIMAVADIFEALTASDRPYKKSKTLSEAIEILWGFKKRQHIDGDVFDLFLTSGVYLRYARRFLAAELIDEVDITRYLGPVTFDEARAAPRRRSATLPDPAL